MLGSGRSGTTWVAETLLENYDFEPLSDRSSWPRGFQEGCYIDPEHSSSDHENYFKKHVNAKFIRANNLAAWLLHWFSELKIVYLLRHPASVAQSVIRLQWQSSYYELLGNEHMFIGPLEQLREPMLSYKRAERFEQEVASWCAANYLINTFEHERLLVVRYEDLIEDDEWNSLFEFFGSQSKLRYGESWTTWGGRPMKPPPHDLKDRSLRVLESFGMTYR